MLAKTFSLGLLGLEAYPITIEADISTGLPAFNIVGLPDSAVRESRERVRAAIKNSGYGFPGGRITINLSPADTKKEGPAFDLAIALSILAASEQIPAQPLSDYIFLGELSLDGNVMPVNGMLCYALALKEQSYRGLVIPLANVQEASMARRLPVHGVRLLNETIHFLQDPAVIPPAQEAIPVACQEPITMMDFSDIKGQGLAKRAMEVAAAGAHNILLIGPPGSGKTMLAKRLTTILPDMTHEEALEVTKIHSVVGLLPASGLARQRPFRMPHHTCSDIALIGGGSQPRAGEVSLAHNGILFLDELLEFDRHTLEVLRQPMEDHTVTIARAARTIKFPARFMLVAAMNPCPCGYRSGGAKPCTCSDIQVSRYLSKISGPLLDRIDIHLNVTALKPTDMFDAAETECSAAIKQRTCAARVLQHERFKDHHLFANAQMNSHQIKTFCQLDDQSKDLLKNAIHTLGLSGRAHDKILKVARTISDLSGNDRIQPVHIAEAISYRTLDRSGP